MEPASIAATCSACGAPAAAGAGYCSQCGHPLAAEPAGAMQAKPKWYYNVWFTFFMLFFVLGPFGLPLVWKNPHFSRRVKGVLTVIMVFYTLLLVDVTIRAFRFALQQAEQLNATFQF